MGEPQLRRFLLGSRVLDASRYNDAMRLYERTFPEATRVPTPEVLRSWQAGKRDLWFALLDEDVVGFAITLRLPSASAELLEYFAVEPNFQGRGIGGELVEAMKTRLRALGRRRLLVECRHPNQCVGEDDRRAANRRIAFYGRHGGMALPAYPVHYCPDFATRGVARRILLQFPLLDVSDQPSREELASAVLDILELSYLGVDSYLYPWPETDPLGTA